MSQARVVWKRIKIILIREGAGPRVSGFFFKTVVQPELLFGSDTWVVTPCMGRALGGFHYQVARRLTGPLLQRKTDGKWNYNLAVMAREGVRFHKMEEHIRRQQNTVTQYIATQSLIDLYEGLERLPGGLGEDAVVGAGGHQSVGGKGSISSDSGGGRG